MLMLDRDTGVTLFMIDVGGFLFAVFVLLGAIFSSFLTNSVGPKLYLSSSFEVVMYHTISTTVAFDVVFVIFNIIDFLGLFS